MNLLNQKFLHAFVLLTLLYIVGTLCVQVARPSTSGWINPCKVLKFVSLYQMRPENFALWTGDNNRTLDRFIPKIYDLIFRENPD